jgi:hypothetical protein
VHDYCQICKLCLKKTLVGDKIVRPHTVDVTCDLLVCIKSKRVIYIYIFFVNVTLKGTIQLIAKPYGMAHRIEGECCEN